MEEKLKDGGTKLIVFNLSKQHTDKQGWEAAELAPRVAARRWHRAGGRSDDQPFLHDSREKLSSLQYRYLWNLIGWSAEEACMVGRSCVWRSNNAHGTCRVSTYSRLREDREVQSENYSKFLGEMWDVSRLPLF